MIERDYDALEQGELRDMADDAHAAELEALRERLSEATALLERWELDGRTGRLDCIRQLKAVLCSALYRTPAPADPCAPCFGCGLDPRAEPSVRARADGKSRCNSCESKRRGMPDMWDNECLTREVAGQTRFTPEPTLLGRIDDLLKHSSIPVGPGGELHPLFAPLDRLSDKLCQSHAYIIKALTESGLSLVSTNALHDLRSARGAR